MIFVVHIVTDLDLDLRKVWRVEVLNAMIHEDVVLESRPFTDLGEAETLRDELQRAFARTPRPSLPIDLKIGGKF